MEIWLMLVTIIYRTDNIETWQLEFTSRENCERAGQMYVSLYKSWFDKVDALCIRK